MSATAQLERKGRLMGLVWKASVNFPVTESRCCCSNKGRDRTMGKSRTMIGAVCLGKGIR